MKAKNHIATISTFFIAFMVINLVSLDTVLAQDTLLNDINGDNTVKVLFFGDSITAGVGDGFASDEEVQEVPPVTTNRGFPIRVREQVQVSVSKKALPGEVFTVDGIRRYAETIPADNADLVFLLEGYNDAIFRTDSGLFENSVQKAINIATASNKRPVLATLTPPCCDRSARADFTRAYSRKIRSLGNLNSAIVTDFERLWENLCPNLNRCALYNRPEGLHPNSRGYDAMAQHVSATLFNLDIFSAEGVQNLATLLNLPVSSILTSQLVGPVPQD